MAETSPRFLGVLRKHDATVVERDKAPWLKTLAEQAQAVRAALNTMDGPVTKDEVARSFRGARVDRVGELLETLVSLGQARVLEEGRFVA